MEDESLPTPLSFCALAAMLNTREQQAYAECEAFILVVSAS